MENRQLGIKVASVRRNTKELCSYILESEKQKNVVDKMANACPHELRKQQEVLAETEAMLPLCQRRVEESTADLRLFLQRHSSSLAGLDSALVEEAGKYI